MKKILFILLIILNLSTYGKSITARELQEKNNIFYEENSNVPYTGDVIYFNDDEEQISKERYENGIPYTGDITSNDNNGELKSKEKYKDGKLASKESYMNGKLITIEVYCRELENIEMDDSEEIKYKLEPIDNIIPNDENVVLKIKFISRDLAYGKGYYTLTVREGEIIKVDFIFDMDLEYLGIRDLFTYYSQTHIPDDLEFDEFLRKDYLYEGSSEKYFDFFDKNFWNTFKNKGIKDGKVKFYYPNSKIVKATGNLKDGLKDGNWTYYNEDGSFFSNATLKNGIVQDAKKYKSRGTIGEIKDGTPYGIWKYSEHEIWKDGVVWESNLYFENMAGDIKDYGHIKNGVKNGEWYSGSSPGLVRNKQNEFSIKNFYSDANGCFDEEKLIYKDGEIYEGTIYLAGGIYRSPQYAETYKTGKIIKIEYLRDDNHDMVEYFFDDESSPYYDPDDRKSYIIELEYYKSGKLKSKSNNFTITTYDEKGNIISKKEFEEEEQNSDD